jgi:hypothetical protein
MKLSTKFLVKENIVSRLDPPIQTLSTHRKDRYERLVFGEILGTLVDGCLAQSSCQVEIRNLYHNIAASGRLALPQRRVHGIAVMVAPSVAWLSFAKWNWPQYVLIEDLVLEIEKDTSSTLSICSWIMHFWRVSTPDLGRLKASEETTDNGESAELSECEQWRPPASWDRPGRIAGSVKSDVSATC